MLDALRRHSSSWLVRVAFGAIIASFVLFFGYSASVNFRGATDERAIATVNGHPISDQLFRLFLERNEENLAKTLKPDQPLPDVARKMIEQSTMRQMALRTLLVAEARREGLLVTDERLASHIVKGQTPTGESFDPISYRHRFLPFFRQHYGIDYEKLVREEILIETVGDIFDPVTLRFAAKEKESSPPPLSILDAWIEEVLTHADIRRLVPE